MYPPLYKPLAETEDNFSEEQLRELLGTRVSGFIVEDPKDFSNVTLSLSNLDYDFAVEIVIKKITKHDTNSKFYVRFDEKN